MLWRRNYLGFSVALILFCFARHTLAQSSGSETPPLGDVAKKSQKTPGAKAKIVINDDNLRQHSGPIPPIVLEGVDNSDEIIMAIRDYRKTHTPSETEQAVRLWYEDSDAMFLRKLQDNARLLARKEDRRLAAATGDYAKASDYEKAVEQVNDEVRDDRDDFRAYRRNGLVMARIQQAFIKVRNDLRMCGYRYEWFKIRNGNGNGSF